MTTPASPTPGAPAPLARLLKTLAKVEPGEVKAVAVSFVYFALLMGSYFVVRPVRDAMGTVYGVDNLEELYTGTFIASFFLAPAYAFLASRIRLATFLPWVYGFIAVTMFGFFALFESFGAAAGSLGRSVVLRVGQHLQRAHHLGLLEPDGRHVLSHPGQAAVRVHRRRRHRGHDWRPGAGGAPRQRGRHQHADAHLGGRLHRHRLAGPGARAGETTTARGRARRADDDAGSHAGRESDGRVHAALPFALPADDCALHPADDDDLHDHLLPARRPHHQGLREPRGPHARLRDDRPRRERHDRVPAALRHRSPHRALRRDGWPAS